MEFLTCAGWDDECSTVISGRLPVHNSCWYRLWDGAGNEIMFKATGIVKSRNLTRRTQI